MLLVRGVLAALVFIAANTFVFWIAAAFIPSGDASPFLASLLALVVAVVAAWFAWRRGPRAASDASMGRYILKGAVVTGAIGFVGGFFGPMVFAPGANQGPLLGLFITGPGGFVLGAIGGAIYWVARGRPAKRD